MRLFKSYLFAKWIFAKPKKTKVLIFDRTGERFYKLFFEEKSYEILDKRYESINICILLITFFKSGIINFKDNYTKNFINSIYN